MIFRNAFADAPLLSVEISGGIVPDNQIAIVELTTSENKHDTAVITYAGFPGEAVTAYRGLPVSIMLGNNEANMIRFVGYVAYVDFEANTRMGVVNKSLIQTAQVVCFGASYDMKAVHSTTYRNKTLPQIVKTLAAKYNLSFAVPNNRYVFPLVEQSEKSDWELLVQLANTLGYYVHVHGTHINVYDPFSSYYRTAPAVELHTISQNAKAERRAGNIYELKGTFGDVTPDGNAAQWVLRSLDVQGKEVSYSTTNSRGSGLGRKIVGRFTHDVTFNATSQDTLKQFSEKYIKAGWPFNATASVMGVSTALPGRLAKVMQYDSKFDGYWVIEEAKHTVNAVHYITDLKLKTDATNEEPLQSPAGASYRLPPDPALVNNLWKSSGTLEYIYEQSR